MGKRNRLEIMARILGLCKEPQNKTRIMCGTSLSWRMLLQYLSLPQSIGLLEVHHSPTNYLITQKGLEFLKKWKELTRLL